MVFENSLDFARKLDAQDPFKGYRDQFDFPVQKDGSPYLYLCGNSLGLRPKKSVEYVNQELEETLADDCWL